MATLFEPEVLNTTHKKLPKWEPEAKAPSMSGDHPDWVRLRLLAMRTRGVILEVRDGKLLGKPARLLTADDREAIARDRATLIRLVELGPCPTCRKQLWANSACYHCCDRRCEVPGCTKQTGSAFIRMCFTCAQAEEEASRR